MPVLPPFVALNVTGDVPAVVGAPANNPVAVFADNPKGKAIAPKLVGEFVAVI